MTADDVDSWVAAYRRAWESNDANDIAALFTEDARYLTEPYAAPWVGHDAIVSGWFEHRDEPGDTTFAHEIVAVCDGLAFVRGHTTYASPPREYSNLWVIDLAPDGRAREFTEWWMEHR
jgi:uncharacterized protein (TIGR02246 family)